MNNKLYEIIDTPSLIIDEEIVLDNIKNTQALADSKGVLLRPHIKTHRMPYFAKLQMKYGATGIACAKIGEAEVMANHGIQDIFIANEIVGILKYKRLKALRPLVKKLRIGIDNTTQVDQIEQVFSTEKEPLEVLIEYEVGENRSGVIEDTDLIHLVKYTLKKKHIIIKGIFSHEGHTYKAANRIECISLAENAYRRTLHAADLMRNMGVEVETISVGATPSILNGAFTEGITELRIGTYIFFDVGQASAIEDFSHCAATVLATVISKPNKERVVIDAGAKALVSQNRNIGICATNGFGRIKNFENVTIAALFDEHGVIINKAFNEQVKIGDKVEVIPSHICPTVNLYDKAILIKNNDIVRTIDIACRGKSQ